MGRRIIKKIGGERLGSGSGMKVAAVGYGYSTHDVSQKRITSATFGTILPVGQYLLPSNSKLTMRLDALITSNALLYQLYGSAKFQLDVFSADVQLYNPKMGLNLLEQGYKISDVKFPLLELQTRGFANDEEITDFANHQINPSSLLRAIGISANGQHKDFANYDVTRQHNAMFYLMYYQIYKDYYANKQEKKGYIIHTGPEDRNVTEVKLHMDDSTSFIIPEGPGTPRELASSAGLEITLNETQHPSTLRVLIEGYAEPQELHTVWATVIPSAVVITCSDLDPEFATAKIYGWNYASPQEDGIRIAEFDLKAIDRMTMKLHAEIESPTAVILSRANTEMPYKASLDVTGNTRMPYSILHPLEGIALGTYNSDVFNNYLDNETINALTAKSKVQVAPDGTFTIDALNIIQKMYNYDQRIGITDGTLEEWRELTYGEQTKGQSLKPVYEGGLSKEIVFDMVVSTAGTEQEPLGSIASRGQFGEKHKGGYAEIHADKEKLVMVMAKITPRIVYSQGNHWTTNLKTLDDLHKPVYDKIGYQNLLTDQVCAVETQVAAGSALTTFSMGKQPAWQWYRTDYDQALGNIASTENYKVFGRNYEMEKVGTHYKVKDLTTYIDPTKFNDVFAIQSLDAMNFDLQVGIDAKLTLVMSEEVIPNL